MALPKSVFAWCARHRPHHPPPDRLEPGPYSARRRVLFSPKIREAPEDRNGVRWWQWDPTNSLIAGLQLFGLTRRLKRTPVFQIQRALLAMQFTRARERLAKSPDAGHSHIEQLRARLAHEYESFLAAVADWARVKEQWLGEKKRAVLQQWEHVDLQSKLPEIERRLSLQLLRM